MTILETRAVTKIYHSQSGWMSRKVDGTCAVRDVWLTIGAGESVALIGGSGSGKSTLARLLLGLERPTCGVVRFKGKDLGDMSSLEKRAMRRELQMIFQNSLAAFDPLFTVEQIIAEPLRNYGMRGTALRSRIGETMEQVGLARKLSGRLPRELSGGQQQRVGIARAIALRPQLILCDEPLSSLDAAHRRQAMTLLESLKRQLGLAYLFITHDLSSIERLCDTVHVMREGLLVERLSGAGMLQQAKHPYTLQLLHAIPIFDPAHRASRA